MGRKQTYRVQLSEEEREQLRTMSRTGKQSARVMQRAQILLWSDAGKQDKEIIELLGCAAMTVSSTRERWVKEKRLEDLPRKGSNPMLDGKQESLLVALACSDAPEGRDTPKHASWLNMAEIEFSVMVGQCLKRRIGDQATLMVELSAYVQRRNAAKATICWQFDIQQARTKLGRLYPQLP